MKTLLKIGCENFVLKDAAHVQTILKVLSQALRVSYDEHRDRPDGKLCYYVYPDQSRIGVEMIDDSRIRQKKTEPAIEPEIISDPDEIIITTSAGIRRRRRLLREGKPAIDFNAMRAAIDGPKQTSQLLLTSGMAV